MKLIPTPAATRRQNQIDSRLADAVRALRVADTKLGLAAEAYDDRHECLDATWFIEARYTARFFADHLGNSAKSLISHRVFQHLARFMNKDMNDSPHVHGAVMCLMLADRCLTAALEAAGQLDWDDIDQPYQGAFAARGSIRNFIVAITSSIFVAEHDDMLDAILTGTRLPASGTKELTAA